MCGESSEPFELDSSFFVLNFGCFMSEVEQNVRTLLFFDTSKLYNRLLPEQDVSLFFSFFNSCCFSVFNRSVVTGFLSQCTQPFGAFPLDHCNSSHSSTVLQQKRYICV